MLCWLTHWGDSRISAGVIQIGGEDRSMASAVRLREDYSASELRALARRSKNVNQSRRLQSLAAVRDGMDRGSAAEARRDGPPDAARLGPSLQRVGSGGPRRQLDGGSQASSFGGSVGGTCADDWSRT